MPASASRPLSSAINEGHQQLMDAIHALPLKQWQLEEGQPLLHQGEHVNALYWVEKGEFTLHYAAANGKEFGLGIWQGNRRLFGEVELLTGLPCQFDVVPLAPVIVRQLPRAKLESLLIEHPKIGLWLSQQLAGYYQQQMQRNMTLSLYPLAHNIALDLMQRRARGEPDLKLYQEAARFGCSERVYRRVVAQLTELGLLEKRGGRLEVVSQDKLTAFLDL
ncbi:Crp/Fnr family transcriptional regulator [Ferrimonas sp. SCSIO 43195]|uniref:Crp/Fnr family transcriptional regulator n=1 Tax=Ferrimonas sp. SCSIO 43195 TaxID=2822844 RepID=UPI002076201D|nr:Crp/Fnr family transcriptional regulator [Ferrimonas sp. SCSIO 43195]USD37065.1 Crp/Fnr family transcriptional regulator [Ferrimonas sp. SCSIO 43195]